MRVHIREGDFDQLAKLALRYFYSGETGSQVESGFDAWADKWLSLQACESPCVNGEYERTEKLFHPFLVSGQNPGNLGHVTVCLQCRRGPQPGFFLFHSFSLASQYFFKLHHTISCVSLILFQNMKKKPCNGVL